MLPRRSLRVFTTEPNRGDVMKPNRKFNADTLPIPERGQLDVRVTDSAAGLHVRTFAPRGDVKPNRIWFIRGRLRKPKDIRPVEPGLTDRQLNAAASRAAEWLSGRPTAPPVKAKLPAPIFVRLGAVGEMNLADAEAEAHRVRKMLRDGLNPVSERNATLRTNAAKGKTFRTLIAEYLADPSVQKKLRPSTLRNRKWALNKGLASLHETRLASLGEREIESVRPANRNSETTVLAPLRSLLTYAVQRGYLTAAPKIKVAMPEGNAAPMVEFAEGKPSDFSELVEFLKILDTLAAPWPQVFKFGALTGARWTEVIGLDWSELDLAEGKAIWTLPAARSKIKRDCARPLSEAAAAILRGIGAKPSGLVWPGPSGNARGKSNENRAISATLAARGYPTGFWYGRLRDSVASWLEFQSDATERAMAVLLNHKPPAANTRQRHYAKISADHQARTLIERWASAVAAAQAGKPSGDVVHLAERRPA